MNIIGIDTGANGSIALIKKDGIEITRNNKEITETVAALNRIKLMGDCICYIEKVQIFMSDNYDKGKQFGIRKLLDNYKQNIDALKIAGINYIEVYPQTWQSKLGLKKIKGESKIQRKARYKQVASELFKLKATNYDADALLIAYYGYKNYQN